MAPREGQGAEGVDTGPGRDMEENKEAKGQGRVSSGHRNTCPYVYVCVHGHTRTHEHSHRDHQGVRGGQRNCMGLEGGAWDVCHAGSWKLLQAQSVALREVAQQGRQLETHAMDLMLPSQGGPRTRPALGL